MRVRKCYPYFRYLSRAKVVGDLFDLVTVGEIWAGWGAVDDGVPQPGVHVVALVPVAGPVPPPMKVVIPDASAS